MSSDHEITSHESFSHDSLQSLGYDWERIADPGIAARFPLKIYLPRTTADVVRIVDEVRALGQTLKIRSKGHSSNDLVLTDGGAVLCTEMLDAIGEIDEAAGTVTIGSGAVLARVDQALTPRGWGLKVIGDHNHITAGGFASVGGISPGSHRHGLFVDTVQAVEYVTWDGRVVRCDRSVSAAELMRVLAGTGQHGVITTLTVSIYRVDKDRTILRNRRMITRDLERFVRESGRLIADPGEVEMERGVWLDYPIAGRRLRIGQFSAYHSPSSSAYARFRNAVSYRYLHFLGRIAGRLRVKALEMAVKMLGMIGIMLSPRHASIRNIESFTDKVIDSSVGDPTRMLIVLAPVDQYERLFLELLRMCEDVRTRTGALTFISFYVKAIKSPYLAAGSGREHFCELMMYLGVVPHLFARELDDLVRRIDELTAAAGGYRYMHTKTVTDPVLRARVDPNARYLETAGV